MGKYKFITLLCLVAAISAGVAAISLRKDKAEPSYNRPNILLITLDTTRMDHLSCYGHPKELTPSLDELAQEGLKYEFAISPSSWTLPAHASLFTGMLPVHHNAHYGVGENANVADIDKLSFYTLHPAFPTLAEQLKQAGYWTGAVISAPILHSKFGFSKGFDTYDDKIENQNSDRDADITTSLAIDWIRAYHSGPKVMPFFLFLNYFDPHTPYDAPPPWGKENQPRELINVVSGHYDDVFAGLRDVADEERELLLSQYEDEIRFMDAQIGKLFSEMKALNLYDQAFIVVTSDHGEFFGEHNSLDHGHALYEELIRVPLIIKYPASNKKSGVVKEPVSTRGIMPTILAYLQLPIPPTADYGTLDGKPKDLIAEIYTDIYYVRKHSQKYDRDQKAIYDGDFKFIWSSDGKCELYDIAKDPREMVNLYGQMPDVEQRLSAKLEPLIAESNRLNSLSTPQLDLELRRRLQALGYIQ